MRFLCKVYVQSGEIPEDLRRMARAVRVVLNPFESNFAIDNLNSSEHRAALKNKLECEIDVLFQAGEFVLLMSVTEAAAARSLGGRRDGVTYVDHDPVLRTSHFRLSWGCHAYHVRARSAR